MNKLSLQSPIVCIFLALLVLILPAGCEKAPPGASQPPSGGDSTGAGDALIIFHAGSLSVPFDNMGKVYEKKYGMKVQREAVSPVHAVYEAPVLSCNGRPCAESAVHVHPQLLLLADVCDHW